MCAVARDIRAEAIRAWRKLRPHVQAWSLPKIMEQLESLARREYEAGYEAGLEQAQEQIDDWKSRFESEAEAANEARGMRRG